MNQPAEQLPPTGDAELSVEDRIAAKYADDVVPEETGDATQQEPTLNEDGEELELDNDQESEGDELDDELEDDGELSLAEYLGIDEDQLTTDDDGNVMINAKVDGKVTQVPLNKLVDSYQLQEHVNNTSTKLGIERKEFETKRDEEMSNLGSKLEEAGALLSYLENSITGDYQSVKWDELRAEDPAEWAALQSEFQQRANGLQQMKQVIQEQFKELNDKAKADREAKQREYEKEQASIILKNNPTWVDAEVRGKAIAEQAEFLKSTYGFTDEIISTVKDARIVELIKDAKALHDAKRKAANAKVKDNIPKFQRPGAQRKAQTAKARQVKAQKVKLRQTGKESDAAALILDRM